MAEHKRCREAPPVYGVIICIGIVISFAVLLIASGETANLPRTNRLNWSRTLPWSKRATNLTVISDRKAELYSLLEAAATFSPPGMDKTVMVAQVNDGFFPMAHNLYKQLKVSLDA
jgi:hypothetical protein